MTQCNRCAAELVGGLNWTARLELSSYKVCTACKRYYDLWQNMMYRCYKPNARSYSRYGGRGIRVHSKWHDREVFVNDILEALGPRPKGGSLERIDNNGNYAPDNVCWATVQEQNANRTSKHSDATSTYLGVTWYSNYSKWKAQAYHQHKVIFLGYFVSEEDAARAFDKWAITTYGSDCTKLNFPADM